MNVISAISPYAQAAAIGTVAGATLGGVYAVAGIALLVGTVAFFTFFEGVFGSTGNCNDRFGPFFDILLKTPIFLLGGAAIGIAFGGVVGLVVGVALPIF